MRAGVQLTCSIIFLKLHPLPIQHTPSYENSVIFAGVCWGIGLGLARYHASVDFFAASSLTTFPTSKAIFIFWRRMVVGEHFMLACQLTWLHTRSCMQQLLIIHIVPKDCQDNEKIIQYSEMRHDSLAGQVLPAGVALFYFNQR